MSATRPATAADLVPGACVFYRSQGVEFPATITRVMGADPLTWESRAVWLAAPTILGGLRPLDFFGCDLRVPEGA